MSGWITARFGHTAGVSGDDSGWARLSARFTPGWPWPEESWGMDPMYGPEGWCHACGTPVHEPTGPLVMQGRKFPTAEAWTPNWLFDTVCISASLAAHIDDRFDVAFGEVHKPRTGDTGVRYLIPEQTVDSWYDAEFLDREVRVNRFSFGPPQRDSAGATCAKCHKWRWMPWAGGGAPVHAAAICADSDVLASPEIFGDGSMTYRHLLFRLPLAQLIASSAPRLWNLEVVAIA